VQYLRGSPVEMHDLNRACAHEAIAVILLTTREQDPQGPNEVRHDIGDDACMGVVCVRRYNQHRGGQLTGPVGSRRNPTPLDLTFAFTHLAGH
jgi:hypothetical protein